MFGRRNRDSSAEADESTESTEAADHAGEEAEPADQAGGEAAAGGAARPADPEAAAQETAHQPETPAPTPSTAPHSARAQGPWDADEDRPAVTGGHVPLGSLDVPILDGVEIRVDMDAEQQVVATTLTDGRSAVQVAAFAAPRSGGLWAEVLPEIHESIGASGGELEVVAGPYGPELKGVLIGIVPDQGQVAQPVRFVGIDGPRWMLRALWTGAAAAEGDESAPLLVQALRGVVVHRGTDAMAPRDQLPLRLPPEAAQAAEQAAAEQAAAEAQQQQAPQLPERGPETTELR